MAKINPLLPGKLGNPELSLGSDPRLDPRLVTLFNQGEAMDEMLEESDTVNAGSSYEEWRRSLHQFSSFHLKAYSAFAEHCLMTSFAGIL